MEKKQDIKKVELLEQMTNYLIEAQRTLFHQSLSMVSAIIREMGTYEDNGDISIAIANDQYYGAGVLMGNRWEHVTHICLRHTHGTSEANNFEVYFKYVPNGFERNDIYDLEDVEEFDTDIFGERKEYSASDILYFLQDYMLGVLKGADAESVEEYESTVND